LAAQAAVADGRPRRSLILAGGGVKIAFQAGVLQVLLDEAEGLEFDHVDGASGGVFNLAMLCQGQSGRRIADNWRNFQPLSIVQVNPKILLGESIGRLDQLRDRVFPDWGLDFNAIRASPLEATFSVYNFSRHELVVLAPADLTPDLLVAGVSLPMWFPAVKHRGDVLFDPVYITDANLDEAIRRGADELWVVWTVSRRGRYRGGFIHQYFQIIETASYGLFKRALQRIEASNEALAAGRHAEYDRHITVNTLYAEVGLHYIVNVARAPFKAAVEQGVQAGRDWCRELGIPLRAPAQAPAAGASTVSFTEEMAGAVALGETDPESGHRRARNDGSWFKVHLTVEIEDLDRMLDEPQHEGMLHGWVQAPQLGGRLSVEAGAFNLFVSSGDPRRKEMRYRLFFRDGTGRKLTFDGVKYVRDDAGADAWRDTTTLHVRLLEGHVGVGREAAVVGSGILRISLPAFARQLTTFDGAGPGRLGGLRAVLRYGWAFMGQLVRVYALRAGRGSGGG
jgi:predicted acylesterase/phospholipase RssA